MLRHARARARAPGVPSRRTPGVPAPTPTTKVSPSRGSLLTRTASSLYSQPDSLTAGDGDAFSRGSPALPPCPSLSLGPTPALVGGSQHLSRRSHGRRSALSLNSSGSLSWCGSLLVPNPARGKARPTGPPRQVNCSHPAPLSSDHAARLSNRLRSALSTCVLQTPVTNPDNN